MELTAAIAVIVAAITPFITALFTRPTMSDTAKRLIAGTVALILGAIVAIATGKVTGVPADWITSLTWLLVTAAVVISLAQGFYSAFRGLVKTVEVATSPATPSVEDVQDVPVTANPVTVVVNDQAVTQAVVQAVVDALDRRLGKSGESSTDDQDDAQTEDTEGTEGVPEDVATEESTAPDA